jgi:predicted CoA-binding protein
VAGGILAGPHLEATDMFVNPPAEDIARLLRAARTIAIVGLSPDRTRPSLRLKLPALWLQEGIVDEAAAVRAVRAGILTIMDRCLFKERAALR